MTKEKKNRTYSEKANDIVKTLEKMKSIKGDTRLKNVMEIIERQVMVYDDALLSWDAERQKKKSGFSEEDIFKGESCCNAALDMAEGIINEIRIKYLK